jgi:16S rRNA (cytosine967-C5)-methyltransferase
MTPAARIAAAIEVLADCIEHRRPAAEAMRDWGLSHRFAGSKDRAAIASLLFDALRRRASSGWLMQGEGARAVMLGMLHLERGHSADEIAALCDGSRHAPAPLTEAETACLARGSAALADAPLHVAGDAPEWIAPKIEAMFGAQALAELQALAHRAPVDLRANRLKAERWQLQEELAHLSPQLTRFAPDGLRIPLGPDGRGPDLQSQPAFLKGWFEVQDEGSQIVAELAGAQPDEQVVDLCAGAGGKTLALAAAMDNQGQIFATDLDARRLVPIHDRIRRAGLRNVQVRTPRHRDEDALADLGAKADLVLVDAPCTGSGTWRRNPDSKWRLRPGSLSQRVAEQARVLDRAAPLVAPGGRIVYITCSILADENDEAIDGFLARHPDFRTSPILRAGLALEIKALAAATRATRHGVQLSPALTSTDGFYAALLVRA